MEVFINLTKYDTVVAIDEKILPGSLVLDSLNPFPGYYHETPVSSRPMYIYLVLDKQYTLERVLRTTQNIAKEHDWDFDAGKAYISIGSQFLNAIRLRHLPEFDLAEKIQEAYQKQEINFLMNKKIKGKLEAEVKISKFSTIEEVGEGIYVSSNEPTFSYIEIPKHLKTRAFEKVSMDVKYNWEGHEFDAARCSIYYNGTLKEMVRIRSSKNDLDYLAAIKKLYQDKIR